MTGVGSEVRPAALAAGVGAAVGDAGETGGAAGAGVVAGGGGLGAGLDDCVVVRGAGAGAVVELAWGAGAFGGGVAGGRLGGADASAGAVAGDGGCTVAMSAGVDPSGLPMTLMTMAVALPKMATTRATATTIKSVRLLACGDEAGIAAGATGSVPADVVRGSTALGGGGVCPLRWALRRASLMRLI